MHAAVFTAFVALTLMLAPIVGAQPQSLEDLKKWFESDAAAIMQEPTIQRLGTYNAAVKNLRLNGCDLSWTAENGSLVRVPLKSIDPQSVHLQASKLLEVRTIVSLEMTVRENGEPVTTENGTAFSEMTMRRVVALCQNSSGKP